MKLKGLALGTSKNCSPVGQLGSNLSRYPGQGLHKQCSAWTSRGDALGTWTIQRYLHYTKFHILCSADGFPVETGLIGK